MRFAVIPLCVVGAALAACVARPTAPSAIPVFFQNDSVMLSAEAQQAVAQAAEVARENPQTRVDLVGYGLPRAVMMEPVRLSVARADAVRKELVKDGVDAARIHDRGGAAVAPAPDTPVASRRVDISFVR